MDPSQDNLLEKKRAELDDKFAWIRDYVDKGEMTDPWTYRLRVTPLPEHLRGKGAFNLNSEALEYYTIQFLKERNIVGGTVKVGSDDKHFWFCVTNATTRPTPEPRGWCVLQ